MSIAAQLKQFDGKDTKYLAAVLEATTPSDALFVELTKLGADGDTKLQSGATWIMKAMLDQGFAPSTQSMSLLAGSLFSFHHWGACLHLCQSIGKLPIPKRDANPFGRFLRECMKSSEKFLRAWAVDGFYRLSVQHSEYRKEALQWITQMATDDAPSVQARVRNLKKEIEKAK